MHLIFGGAYQGKQEYAMEHYQLNEEDFYSCTLLVEKEKKDPADDKRNDISKPEIDFTKRAVNQLEFFVLNCVRCGVEARDYLQDNRESWRNSVFLCTDISSGVVPCDPELRAWREMVGRTLMYLGKEAEEVTRIFCGIPQKMK